ncbi:hypothetical protein AAG747_14825 [Rapidithrix thailandica]|uniref:Uncharacterized protein n=1 Tax=Rapidithrix thailandica TaxID=413964 RepID=A0AAW9S9Q2_9BACT
MEDYSFLKLLINEELYIIQESEATSATPAEVPLTYIGENQKHYLVITNVASGNFFQSDEYALLIKILGAVGLQLPDCIIINLADNPSFQHLQPLIERFQPVQIFAFGISPSFTDGQDHPFYTSQRYHNSKVMYADSLSTLKSDVHKKRALWSALKDLLP